MKKNELFDYQELARPTLSLAKYLQQVGRGMRGSWISVQAKCCGPSMETMSFSVENDEGICVGKDIAENICKCRGYDVYLR